MYYYILDFYSAMELCLGVLLNELIYIKKIKFSMRLNSFFLWETLICRTNFGNVNWIPFIFCRLQITLSAAPRVIFNFFTSKHCEYLYNVGLQRKSVNYSLHYFEEKKRILHFNFCCIVMQIVKNDLYIWVAYYNRGCVRNLL